MKPWLLVINHHDTAVEWFDTKSEACLRAISLKGSQCVVVGVSELREFQYGIKTTSNSLKGITNEK